jgi:D-aminoacyl-tRNA deacylase
VIAREVLMDIGIAVIALVSAILITIILRVFLSLIGLVSFTDYKTTTTDNHNNSRHYLSYRQHILCGMSCLKNPISSLIVFLNNFLTIIEGVTNTKPNQGSEPCKKQNGKQFHNCLDSITAEKPNQPNQNLTEDIQYLTKKITGLRIFADADSKFNLSVKDIKGELLLVSQFTLLANTRKGRRPSFTDAALPDMAETLFNQFIEQARTTGLKVETGRFQEHMQVEINNDGPVTIMIDSRERFNSRSS